MLVVLSPFHNWRKGARFMCVGRRVESLTFTTFFYFCTLCADGRTKSGLASSRSWHGTFEIAPATIEAKWNEAKGQCSKCFLGQPKQTGKRRKERQSQRTMEMKMEEMFECAALLLLRCVFWRTKKSAKAQASFNVNSSKFQHQRGRGFHTIYTVIFSELWEIH